MLNMISTRLSLKLISSMLLVSPAVIAQQPKPKSAAPAKPSTPVMKKAPANAAAPATEKSAETAPQKGDLAAKAKANQPLWRLKVTKKTPIIMSLTAKKANLSEIAAEMSRKLKFPVVLTPLMQKQRVSLEFEDMPLEGALRLLAPQVYIDYELTGDASGQPKPIGIFLQGMNEEPPAESAVVKGDSEALLIEGNTEDGLDTSASKQPEKQPLLVVVEKNQISVQARKQPLTAVLYEIASKVDIPFEMKYESTELVDVDFNNYTMEQVVRTLSPNIRLYQRTNLTNYEVRPLRLVLVPPANHQQTTKM
ncbi:MAG: hypothetical protein ACR2G4_01735 [Pyrinomonadaceae bacterium]